MKTKDNLVKVIRAECSFGSHFSISRRLFRAYRQCSVGGEFIETTSLVLMKLFIVHVQYVSLVG